jgi:hypothetical protein
LDLIRDVKAGLSPNVDLVAQDFRDNNYYGVYNIYKVVLDDMFDVLATIKGRDVGYQCIRSTIYSVIDVFENYLVENVERLQGTPKSIELKNVTAYDKKAFEWVPHFTRSGKFFISLIDPLSQNGENYGFNRSFMKDTAREENNWRRERGFDYGTIDIEKSTWVNNIERKDIDELYQENKVLKSFSEISNSTIEYLANNPHLK